jgi:hypothetical protein
MKKIFYFIALTFALTACCAAPSDNMMESIPTNDRVHMIYGTFSIHKLEYKNHMYIILKGDEQIALEHDPDCPCHYNF